MFTNNTNSIVGYSLPEINSWASIVGQWLRILLPMQGHGFDPWSRKTPHATGQLSPWATAAGPMCLEPELCSKRSHFSKKPTHHRQTAAPTLRNQRKPTYSKGDPPQPINKSLKKKKHGTCLIGCISSKYEIGVKCRLKNITL